LIINFYITKLSFLLKIFSPVTLIIFPQFLLTQGDWQSPRHSAPYTGVLLIPSFIFLLIGLFTSHYSTKTYSSINLFFLLWLLLAPIPAALTRDSVQATRIMSFSLPLCYFSALGIVSTLNYFKKINFSIQLLNYLSPYLIFFLLFTTPIFISITW